jgi:N-acyl amino acid synthase of PEP-CTERM/exosortase system
MNSAGELAEPFHFLIIQTGLAHAQPITTNTMKTQHLQTNSHWLGNSHHPAHRTHPALKSAMELRYQVYCLECCFLRPDDYPDGSESDEHDDAAEHFFTYDQDDELVGYVRLVRPNAQERFPFQNHCTTFTDGAQLPAPTRAGEISRLILRADYRRLADLPGAADGEFNSRASRRPRLARAGNRRDEASNVILSLYRQVYQYSRSHGIDYWYAAMERRLARSMKRLNIAFKEIGPQTDYYGPVVPYLVNLREVESHAGARNPTLLAWLQQATSASYAMKFECA